MRIILTGPNQYLINDKFTNAFSGGRMKSSGFLKTVFLTAVICVFCANGYCRDVNGFLVEEKILTVQETLEAQRYRLRINEAKEYLMRGDNYYAKGKLLEALGEWSAALALLELLKNTRLDSADQARELLKRELSERLESEQIKRQLANPIRQEKIKEAVRSVIKDKLLLERKAQKAGLAEKQVAPASQTTAVVSEDVSVEELETMKKNRQAVEEAIGAQLGVGKVASGAEDSLTESEFVEAMREEIDRNRESLAQQAQTLKDPLISEDLELEPLVKEDEVEVSDEVEISLESEDSGLEQEIVVLEESEPSPDQADELRKEMEASIHGELFEGRQQDQLAQPEIAEEPIEVSEAVFEESDEAATPVDESVEDVIKRVMEEENLQIEEVEAAKEEPDIRISEIDRTLEKLQDQQTKPAGKILKKASIKEDRKKSKPEVTGQVDRFAIIEKALKKVETRYLD